MSFQRVVSGSPRCETNNNVLPSVVTCYGVQPGQTAQTVVPNALQFTQYTAVHELGHVLVGRTGGYSLSFPASYYNMINSPPVTPPFATSTTLPGTPTLTPSRGTLYDYLSPTPQVVFGIIDSDWVRGQRGWGSAYSISPAVPCDFQQNAFSVVDVGASQSDRERERDEGAADMFLNWVYSKIGSGGFTNYNYIGIANCTITPTPDFTRRPGDARFNFMDNIVMPTLATYFPTPTAAP